MSDRVNRARAFNFNQVFRVDAARHESQRNQAVNQPTISDIFHHRVRHFSRRAGIPSAKYTVIWRQAQFVVLHFTQTSPNLHLIIRAFLFNRIATFSAYPERLAYF